MKPIIPFDVVLVPFPFSDLKSHKKRPCLVLAEIRPQRLSRLYIVAMVTSQSDALNFPHDVQLKNFDQAGLPKPSIVRISKIVTLDEGLIEKKLGQLSESDRHQVKSAFRSAFSALA